MVPLRDSLRTASSVVQNWLDLGDAAGVVPSEESVTDLLLLNFAVLGRDTCRVHRLGKHAENKFGADFLLLLVSRRARQLVGLPLLVQAKRLYPSGRFEALHAAGAKHPQMAVLLETARRHMVLPLYAFYQPSIIETIASTPTACSQPLPPCRAPGPWPGWPFMDHPLDCPSIDLRDLGVVVAHAARVRDLLDTAGSCPSASVVSPESFPLACVADCACLTSASDNPMSPRDDSDDLIARATRRLSRTMPPGAALEPVPVPTWLTNVNRASDGTVLADRTGIYAEVDTVVLITDDDDFGTS